MLKYFTFNMYINFCHQFSQLIIDRSTLIVVCKYFLQINIMLCNRPGECSPEKNYTHPLVTNNSSFQNYTHPDDHTIRTVIK